jgi:hypothetical protein
LAPRVNAFGWKWRAKTHETAELGFDQTSFPAFIRVVATALILVGLLFRPML